MTRTTFNTFPPISRTRFGLSGGIITCCSTRRRSTITLDGTPNLSHLQEAARKYGLTSGATELSYLIHTSCIASVLGGIQSAHTVPWMRGRSVIECDMPVVGYSRTAATENLFWILSCGPYDIVSLRLLAYLVVFKGRVTVERLRQEHMKR